MHTQLVVLGGGPGGYAAAFMAADLGLNVTLVEADSRLGGTCLLRGCIPSKALLHVAKVINEARELAHWGIELGKPQVDLAAMRSRKEAVIHQLTQGLDQLAKRRQVQRIQADGSFANSQTLRLQGGNPTTYSEDHLTFDHCIVATGSRPTMPSAFQLDTPRIMTSTEALDLDDVPHSLLVVGGGYIGLELGTVYAELGADVTMVELTDGLLPGADRDLVKPVVKRMASRFTEILLGTKVVSLTDHGDRIEAQLEGALGNRTMAFDRILVSVGRQPVTAGFGLEQTQVTLDDRGFIEVDAQQRTRDERILAIGDVVGEPMLAHKASHEGKVAAEVLAGHPAAFDALAIPAVVFTDPEIAWAGLTVEQAKREGHPICVAQYPWQASGRSVAIGRTDGLTKWILDPETERILGCGIVGSGAGELIAEAVLAIEMGATARDVADSIHPHPTLSETLAFASEVHLGTATEVYRPKK
ncbi:MAG: dihydrolipoyl dehydrogenase [Pirellulales bacterium]|nr:dihydrolipoyl dehydrogenase [Pirellulales bacterium]